VTITYAILHPICLCGTLYFLGGSGQVAYRLAPDSGILVCTVRKGLEYHTDMATLSAVAADPWGLGYRTRDRFPKVDDYVASVDRVVLHTMRRCGPCGMMNRIGSPNHAETSALRGFPDDT
jgi:hypothetical protein